MPFDGLDGYAAGLEAIASAFAPSRPLSVSKWAQAYRVLSGKAASEPGRWRNERIPYLAAIMDALDPRHPAPVVVLVASSQVGKSECGLNWIGRQCHQMPGSFLVLFPTESVARKWVRGRLDSMIATTPALRTILPLGRRTNAGNTLSEKHAPGFVLYTGSAGIPDDVASISVPYLFLDEVDRMPLALEREGDPIDLAMRRSTTFPRAKCFMTSTPTSDETSRIWPAWQASSMNRYYVPCPHCSHLQYLRWEQLKWISGKPETAGYVCEACAAIIEERCKPEMLLGGQWRPEHLELESTRCGFHVNGLYTPLGLGDTWAKHAIAWESAQGKQTRLQVFFNTRLGEVHKGERQNIEWRDIKARSEPYPLRTIPKGVLVLVSGHDVQADRIESQILGFGRGERITVIDAVVHYGDTTRLLPTGDGEASVWAKLDDYLAQPIINACGVPMRLACSLVDAGYMPDIVLNFTRSRKSRGIFAARGSTNASRQPIGRPAFPDTKRKGKVDQRGAERYEVGVSMLKHWLFEQLRADAGKPDAPVLPADRHITFSTDLPDEYFRQLTAETYDPKNGWIERANYHRNECLDTFIYSRAASMHHSVAVHRMREVDWQRLESLYEPKDGKAKPPAEFGAFPIIRPDGGFLPTRAPGGSLI
jgi:phage terminase large subunit GpA-like protein